MSGLLVGLFLVQLVLGTPCSVLEDPIEVAVLAATGLASVGRSALNCSTDGVICDNDTFDGRCRVVAVPSNRGLQLWCDSKTQTLDVISLPALGLINVTMDAEGAFLVNGCNAKTIFFPRLQMIHAVFEGAGGYDAFRIDSVPYVEVVEFPNLKSISGGTGLTIYEAPLLAHVEFPMLSSISCLNNGIYMVGESQLQHIYMPALRTISLLGDKAIIISNHPHLQNISFSSLQKVVGDQTITIADNDALISLSFPALQSVQVRNFGYGFTFFFSSQRVCVDLHSLRQITQTALSEYVPAHGQDDAFLMLESFASGQYWSTTFNNLPNVTKTNWCSPSGLVTLKTA